MCCWFHWKCWRWNVFILTIPASRKQGKLGILMLQLLWGWFSQCVCHYAPLTTCGWENFFQQMEVIIKWVNDYLNQLMLVPIMLQCLPRTAWGTLLWFETGGARAAECEDSKWIDLPPASVSLFVILSACLTGWLRALWLPHLPGKILA